MRREYYYLTFGILLVMGMVYLVSALDSFYDPISDVVTGWDDGNGVTFDEIDDGVREPSVPDVATNVQSRANDGLVSEFNFNSLSESSINNITLWVYVDNGGNAEFSFELQQGGVTRCSSLAASSTNGWQGCTWDSPTGDLTTITIELGNCIKNGGGAPTNCRVDAAYLDVNYDVVTGDDEYPLFSSFSESPSNGTTYVVGERYGFNVSIINTNGTAGIEFNGVNYSVGNVSDVFNFSVFDLAAGDYGYYWWAFGNGTDGNYNISEMRFYSVLRATQTANLNINETTPVVYGANINVSCNGELFRDEGNVTSEIGTGVLLGVGSYDYSCKLYENQNNSYDDDNSTFVVNIADGNVTMLINGLEANQTSVYGATTNVSASTLYGGLTVYRNGIDETSNNGLEVTLGVGDYNYTANSSGDGNHSIATIERWVHISKASSEVNLDLNGSEGNISIDQGNSILLNGTLISGESVIELYNDNVIINSGSGEVSNLTTFGSIGLFNITVIYLDSQNYSTSSETYWVNVSVALDLNAPYFITIPEDVVINYTQGFGVDFEGGDDIEFDSYRINQSDRFEINQSGYLTNLSSLAVGSYLINVTINDSSGNENSTLFSLIVNRREGSCSISYDGPATYPGTINVSGSCDNPEVGFGLFRDGVDVSEENGLDVSLSAGSFSYVINVTETQNYTSANNSLIATVNQAVPQGSMTIAPSSSVEYPIVTTVTGSESNGGDGDLVYTLYRNNVSVSNPEVETLGVGSYHYVYNVSGGLNYTSNSSLGEGVLVVSQNGNYSLSLSILPSSSESFGSETNSTGSGCVSDISCELFRDGILVSNGDVQTHGVGTYNYTYNTSGNVNYSEQSVSELLVISQISSIVNLTLNGSEENISIQQNDSILLNGTLISGEGILELYRDNVLINSNGNEVSNLTTFENVGLFNITVIYLDSQNYSSSSETYWVNVSAIPDTINPEVTIVYPLGINYTEIQSELNYSVRDNSAIDSCWYSLDGGVNNVTISCGNNVSGLDSGQGSSTWIVYVNDTSGNTNTSSVTFFVDSIEPGVSVVSPVDGNYTNATILVNISSDGDNVWFYNGTGNESYSGSVYRTFGEGSTTLIAYANDSLGNLNQTSITFFVDSIVPDVSIVSPVDGNYTNATILVNITSDGDNVWFFNGSENETYTSEVYRTFSEGSTTLIAYSNDSFGNFNSTSVTFFVDSIYPEISFGDGSESNGTTRARDWIYVNVSVVEVNEASVAFNLYNTSGIVNTSLFVDGRREINWTNLGDGIYFYNVSVTDDFGFFNSTEIRTITLDGSVPTITIHSPINTIYTNSSVLINVTSNGDSVWFTNESGNESYVGSVFRGFSEGSHTFIVYANNSAGSEVSESVTFFVNTLELSCEVGGPYQQGALVLVQGTLRNESGSLQGESINLSVIESGLVNWSGNATTESGGVYQNEIRNLSVGNYLLYANVSVNGINQSCSDSFEVGGSAGFVLDKIGTIHNVSNDVIIYNVSLRLTNTGGADALTSNFSDGDGGLFLLGTINSGESVERNYLLSLSRENSTSYYLSSFASGYGVDSFSGNLLNANSSDLNLTIPSKSIGNQMVIVKNVLYVSETGLNVTYNVSATLYNSGDEDLQGISYVDSDISGTAIVLNLTKGESRGYSNLVVIAKAASNIVHQFALGSVTVGVDTFLSNRPSVSIPGYGGPADAIVYAPATVDESEVFDSTIEVKNVNEDIGQDFTVDFWITNVLESVNYTSGQQTVFVSANGSTNITATLTAPSSAGDYRLRALVTWIVGSATSYDSFEVIATAGNDTGGGDDGGGGGGGGGDDDEPEENETEEEEPEEFEVPEEEVDEGGGEEPEEIEIPEEEPEEEPEAGRGITGLFIQEDDDELKVTRTGWILIIIIAILIILYMIRRRLPVLFGKRRKRFVARLSHLYKRKVYTSDGVKLGKIVEINVENYRIHSFKIKLEKKKKFKAKGIVLGYRHVKGIRDIVIVDERILEKIE